MGTPNQQAAAPRTDETIIDELVRSTRNLRFGQIVLTVHNAKIVQIDKTEKIRLDASAHHDKGSGI